VNCTVDANVLVAAYRASEPHHDASLRFLARKLARATEFFCPAIVLPECGAAAARATGDAGEAAKVLASIRRLPRFRPVVISLALADRAAEIAMQCRIRGADSIYVAVAELFDATLITWDAEMLARVPAVVPTMTPAGWLAQHPATP
jgi:predicted nucleic acid-binding protein